MEFNSIHKKGGLLKGHWEAGGTLRSAYYGGTRSFKYKLDAETGEIREYSVS
jgi:hypothetical protein